MLAVNNFVARVGEDEGPGAVGAFGRTRRKPCLPKQRRLLVAGHAGDGRLHAEKVLRVAGGQMPPAGHDLGQSPTRHSEHLKQFVVPSRGLEAHQLSAGCVGCVRDVGGAAGEPSNKVAVDGAECEASVNDPLPNGRLMPLPPEELAGGEVRVDVETSTEPNPVVGVFGVELGAELGGATVLPHDRPQRRGEVEAIPDCGGFALVGDADGPNWLSGCSRLLHRLQRGLPDLLEVVLDPPRFWKVLFELAVSAGHDLARIVD